MKYIIVTGFMIFSFALMAQDYLPDKIVIKYKKEYLQQRESAISPDNLIDLSRIKPMFEQHRKRGIESRLSEIFVYKAPLVLNTMEYCNALERYPEIEWAEPYYVPQLMGIPNDPLISSQFFLSLIRAYDAHDITHGDTNIVIGIIDTGTDIYHEDLVDNYKYNYNDPINGVDDDYDGFTDNFRGWDMVYNDNNPQTEGNGHGCRVAGAASAVTNNGKGIASVGYQSKILPIKASNVANKLVAAYEGTVYAADHGCQILNLSWGSTIPSNLSKDVISYAIEDKKCLVIVSAGNDNNDVPYYPASYENVISVAGTNAYDLKWGGSTYGYNIDISAPGQSVYSTFLNNQYLAENGTSFASPIVAGAAALVMAYRPDLNSLQIGELLRVTGDIIDTMSANEAYFNLLGKRLNVYNALTDTNAISVRINNLTTKEFSENSKTKLEIEISGINYLSQVTNTTITLSHSSPYLSIINNQYNTGKLKSLDTFTNKSSKYAYYLNASTPYDYNLFMKFNYAGYGYTDYQYMNTIINKSFINVNANNIRTSITSEGRIGYADFNQNIGIGWQYKNYGNVVEQAGITIGNSSNNVYSGLVKERQFEIIEKTDTNSNELYLTGISSFKPAGESGRLSIEIEKTAKAYYDDDRKNAMVYEYTLSNTSNETIDGIKIGMYADFSFFSGKNLVYFNNETNSIITHSIGYYLMYGSICLLNDMKANPYAFDLENNGNGGMDITNGFTNDIIWFTMTNRREKSVDTLKTSTMLTTEEFSLNAGESKTIAFALIAGENDYVVNHTAEVLREKFLNTESNNRLTFKTYPNPADNFCRVSIPKEYANGTISIYNINGTKIGTENISSKREVSIDLTNFMKGVYVIEIRNGEKRKVSKIIKR